MTRSLPSFLRLAACVALICVAGCQDQPQAPPRFQIDPEKAAQEAMRLYDTNQDGKLDAKELAASPPLNELLLGLKARKPDHADALSADDIKGRLEEWNQAPTTLVPATFTVFLDGKRLDGAMVVLEPEPFLGSSYHSHQGTTDAAGMVELDSDLSAYPHNIYVGLYRIRISKTVNCKETIPAKYNVETTLGRELATQTRLGPEWTMLRLTTK